jgi:hypothetical protein
MKVIITKDCVALHVSGNDTRIWAMRPDCKWPCSTVLGVGFIARFDSNGLYDFELKGINKNADDIDGHELSAICCDLLKNRLPKSHPAYSVTVDQFL